MRPTIPKLKKNQPISNLKINALKQLLIAFMLLHLVACGNAQNDAPVEDSQVQVLVGAEQTGAYLPLLEGKRVGLVVNHTSLVDTVHLVDFLLQEGISVQKIFAPEHGFRGTADAGAHVESGRDEATGLPLISLYGSHRKPSSKDLSGLDVVVFDIQDVGVRFYTYISTMSYVMEACAGEDIPFMVLDRPNPNGNLVDGPVMEPCCHSFIGMHPGVPVAHGMTVGEYARMTNREGWISDSADLTVIAMDGWTHDTPYQLPVKPSPNLPNMKSIYLYPTLCFFEATAMSVGRGTHKQFQVIGHPAFPGSYSFTPEPMPGAQDPKLKGQECFGIDFSRIPIDSLQQLGRIRLDWLIEAYSDFPEREEFFLPHFYKLAGNKELEKQIKAGLTEQEIRVTWREGLEQFRKMRGKYLLYP